MATPQRPANPFARLLADRRWRLPALVGVPALAVVAILVAVLLSGGGGDDDGTDGVGFKSSGVAPGSSGSGSVAIAGAGFPGPPPIPTAEPTPDPVVRSLERLRAEHGESPDATHGRLRIPALGVDAPLGVRAVGEDGVMTNPSGPDDVVWYDLSAWDGLGGAPGKGGNAVFAGHVDRTAWLDWAGVEYSGLAVFFYLDNLTPGQQIEVEMDGATHTYTVQWIRPVAASSGEWAEIFGPDPTGADAITLITCGGDFNAVEGSYASRVVVRAVAG